MKFHNEFNNTRGYHFDITERFQLRFGIQDKDYFKNKIRFISWKNCKVFRFGKSKYWIMDFTALRAYKIYQLGIWKFEINVREYEK